MKYYSLLDSCPKKSPSEHSLYVTLTQDFSLSRVEMTTSVQLLVSTRNSWAPINMEFYLCVNPNKVYLPSNHRVKGEIKTKWRDFPGGTVAKNPPANAGDTGLIPGPGRSHMPWSN